MRSMISRERRGVAIARRSRALYELDALDDAVCPRVVLDRCKTTPPGDFLVGECVARVEAVVVVMAGGVSIDECGGEDGFVVEPCVDDVQQRVAPNAQYAPCFVLQALNAFNAKCGQGQRGLVVQHANEGRLARMRCVLASRDADGVAARQELIFDALGDNGTGGACGANATLRDSVVR